MKQKSWHLIGLGGIGMSGLAHLLLAAGDSVSGSDLKGSTTLSALQQLGCRVAIGHAVEHVPADATVVFSSSVSSDNPEWQIAEQRGQRILHRSQLLALMIEKKCSWSVAGTHGKTTTSSLLASVLSNAGCDPSYAIGGVLKEFGCNAYRGSGDLFVFEADESDGTLVNYRSDAAILTNLDDDHLDFYGSLEAQNQAFQQFVDQISNPSHLLWCGDDRRLSQLKLPGISYGFGSDCQLRISRPRQQGWMLCMDLNFQDCFYPDIEVALLGEHNALNAAAVFGLGLVSQIDEQALRTGLASFKGVARRCDHRGSVLGITVVDDYAHHPVEIGATLAALRSVEPSKRLIALFQPHRFTRTLQCAGRWEQAFAAADEVIVTDIYAAGEQPIHGVSPQAICRELTTGQISNRYIPRAELPSQLVDQLQSGDMVVTLGAGDITAVSRDLFILLSGRKSLVSV